MTDLSQCLRGRRFLLTAICIVLGGGAFSRALAGPATGPLDTREEAPSRPSRCASGCTLHGTCNEELGRCDCPRHRRGPTCQETVENKSAVCAKYGFPDVQECIGNGTSPHHHAPPCLNDCNARGECTAGWCRCLPGFYGADCSLSLDAEGNPELLAGHGYAPRQKRPWVYVYELPPRFTTWYNVHRMDRPLHFLLWQRLLSSGARVADPTLADLFFLPLNMRSPHHGALLIDALTHLRARFPWLDKYPERHFIIHTGDSGRIDTSYDARAASANITWLTHWGLHKEFKPSGWPAAHRLDKDFVIPTFLPAGDAGRSRVFLRSPFHPKAAIIEPRAGKTAAESRPLQLSFAGRVCGDRTAPKLNGSWPNCGRTSGGYSQGARQLVHYHHHNRSGYSLRVSDPQYNLHMLQSRFCLAPTGGGFGHRQILVTVAGCAPAVVSDDVLQPLEPALDWRDFSLNLRVGNVSHMHEVIAAVTDEAYERMQVALRCVTQHFIWSSVIGGFMGEDGRYDAFESVLEVLRVKAAHPTAPQHTYAAIDADFRRFMHCGADTYEEAAEMADAAAAKAAKRAAQTGTPAAASPLCSVSAYDGAPYPCRACVDAAHGFVPGGAICCGTNSLANSSLVNCYRPWA